MPRFEADGNVSKKLTREDYTSDGSLVSTEDELALVVQSATDAEQFVEQKQWNLLWRDADMLAQSPRPMTMYENSYVLEPNVTDFTVSKITNSLVPQFYKGIFYENPPFISRPRPGTTMEVVRAKTAVMAEMLDKMQFRREVKYGLECMTVLGTGIWKWGIRKEKIKVPKRKSASTDVPGALGTSAKITPVDEEPEIEWTEKLVCCPYFEYRDVQDVLVDPKLKLPDIREAAYVIDRRFMDFYEVKKLADDPAYDIPEDLIDYWFPVPEQQSNSLDQKVTMQNVVHHGRPDQDGTDPDNLKVKIEVLEYWDCRRCITVIARKKVIRSEDNKFGKIPFYSSNYWNRRKAFWGLGNGTTVGQEQRVKQGVRNAALKILSYAVNPTYLRAADANTPTQMIRTGLGKILTVQDLEKSYKLLDTPKVPAEVFAVLAQSNTEAAGTSGADEQMVQGTTPGPRSSLGRTSGGANIMANASSSRLEGPLDNFIDQVYIPWLYQLDELIFLYVPDSQIIETLGKTLGQTLVVDMEQYHCGVCQFDVLAGTRMIAKRTMAQSLMLITQLLESPQLAENLADINEEFVDLKPIIKIWLEMSEWGGGSINDIIKPLTPAMKQKRQAAQQQSSKAAQAAQLEDQKFKNKQVLLDQANEGRIHRDLVRDAARGTGLSEAVTGEPGGQGFGSNE